ncbi:TPA: hypothetical protein ONC18_004641 [Enterobacter kobei]|nr:hypothetical protein [Enterobacter kobei]
MKLITGASAMLLIISNPGVADTTISAVSPAITSLTAPNAGFTRMVSCKPDSEAMRENILVNNRSDICSSVTSEYKDSSPTVIISVREGTSASGTITFADSNWAKTVIPFDLPKEGSECSVTVNNTPVFADLYAGIAVDPIQLTSNPHGSGELSFKPLKKDESGGLITSDVGGTLCYNVQDSSSASEWVTTSGEFRGDLTKDYILRLCDIPSNVKPGIYNGTVDVTISCI